MTTAETITRLERILSRLNVIHRRRRLAGRPTAHLLGRTHSLSQAFLAARAVELNSPI